MWRGLGHNQKEEPVECADRLDVGSQGGGPGVARGLGAWETDSMERSASDMGQVEVAAGSTEKSGVPFGRGKSEMPVSCAADSKAETLAGTRREHRRELGL